jgi:hypothetical protein
VKCRARCPAPSFPHIRALGCISSTLDQGKLIGYSGPNGETAQYPLNTYRTWYPSLFHHYHSPGLRQLLPHPELVRPGHPIRFTRNPALGRIQPSDFSFWHFFCSYGNSAGGAIVQRDHNPLTQNLSCPTVSIWASHSTADSTRLKSKSSLSTTKPPPSASSRIYSNDPVIKGSQRRVPKTRSSSCTKPRQI